MTRRRWRDENGDLHVPASSHECTELLDAIREVLGLSPMPQPHRGPNSIARRGGPTADRMRTQEWFQTRIVREIARSTPTHIPLDPNPWHREDE